MRKKLDAYTVYLAMQFISYALYRGTFTVSVVYYVETVNLNALQLVVVGTTLEAAVFLFEIPTGVVADVISRRLSILIGFVLVGIGFITQGLLPVFWGVILAQVIWGLGWTFTSGATDAWIADEIGEERASQAFLRGSQVGQAGAILGIVGAIMLGTMGLHLPILASGLGMILLSGGLALVMPEDGFKRVKDSERTTWQSMLHTLALGAGMVRTRYVLLALVLETFIIGLFSEGVDRLWTKHLLDSFALPDVFGLDSLVWFGIIPIAWRGIAALLTAALQRWLKTDDARVAAWILVWAHLLTAGGVVSFALAGSFGWMVASYIVVMVMRMASYPVTTAWMNQHIDSEARATVFSLSSQANAIGQIIGGPPIGLLATARSIRTALLACAAILTPSAPLVASTLWRKDDDAGNAQAIALE